MRKSIGIIVCSIVVGIMATYLLMRKKKILSNTEGISIERDRDNQENEKYKNMKGSAIGNIYSRHEDAATLMKESIEVIHENINVTDNTNQEIKQEFEELEKMLSED